MKLPESVTKQISTLRNLPTLPHILVKLIKVCNQEDTTLIELSEIIKKDPSLCSKILKLVNSAYYGLPQKVKKIEGAVALLGTTAIKNVAISASIYEAFKVKDNGSFNLKCYWWHSLRTGILARRFSQELNHVIPDEAFLAGLLHDIGRLVLLVNFGKQYQELIELHSQHPDLLLAGEARLGATHYEVGAWILERWNLPSFMVDAVLYHHEPIDFIRSASPLVQVVYAANILSQGTSEPETGEPTAEFLEELLGLPDSLVQSIVSKTDKELAEVARSMDIEIEPPGKAPGAPSDKDTGKRLQLIEEVQDISVLLGTIMNLLGAPDEHSLLTAIYQGLQILFDAQEIFIFLYDPDRNGLVATKVGKSERWDMIFNLFIPLKMRKSLLIRALVKRKLLSSFDLNNGLISLDKQLIQSIGKEGILCIPMVAQESQAGVIVIGLNMAEYTHLSQQFNVLGMFAGQAALALSGYQAKERELKTIQTERLGASHEMARKVIHEINNPLSIIKNYLKILAMKLSDQHAAQEEIRIINEEIDRVSQILRDLSALSDVRALNSAPVDINEILSNMVRLIRGPLSSDRGITVHIDLEPGLPYVRGDMNGLKQIFINLIKNAAEALPEGGNIFIETRQASTRLEKEEASSEEVPSGYAEIIIRDDGPGISEEMKKRMFEPFTTSKGVSHSGLGLSIVHNIVKALEGSITCESTKGRGTTFTITLPFY